MNKLNSLNWLGGVVAACAWALSANAEERYEVREVEVAYERVFDGVVESVKQSTVSAQTSGRVEEINFDVNDVVPKGNILLRIDDTEHQARVREADADVRETNARLKEASDDFERIKNLVSRQLASQADLDRTRAQFNASQARHDQAQARLTEAKQHLKYTVVSAPYGGVVVERHVQVGESVQIGQPLMTGFSLDELRVETTIPQDMIAAARSAARVQVLHDGQSIASDKLTIFPFADAASHGFRVRVGLPGGSNGLAPGMFVKVAFPVATQMRLVVPCTAVVQRDEVTGVYVLPRDSAAPAFRYVRLGRPQGSDMVEILAGLQAGESIAVDPQWAATVSRESRQ